MKGIVVLAIGLVMAGCAIQSPIPESGSYVVVEETDAGTITTYNGNSYTTSALAQAQQECFKFKAVQANKWVGEIGGLENEIYKAWVLTHAQTMDMISNVWGTDACEVGTNEFDAYIAYANNMGLINRTAIETAGGVVKTGLIAGFGALAVGSVMDAVGSTVGGDMVTSGQNTIQAGNDISDVNTEDNFTETHSTLSQSQITGAGDQDIQPATNAVYPPEEVEIEEPELPEVPEVPETEIEIEPLEVVEETP